MNRPRRRPLGVLVLLIAAVTAIPAAAAPAAPSAVAVAAVPAAPAFAAAVGAASPEVPWHLTARPWRPTYLDRDRYLDVAEGIARFNAKTQSSDGSIIDAYDRREHQYATPYFAAQVALLNSNGRALDLRSQGMLAMDRATAAVANRAVPEQHGEFYIAPLAMAIVSYRPHASAARYATWTSRMGTPNSAFLLNLMHNWRTYAMKGEWYRAKNGLIDKGPAVRFIESSWNDSQRWRLRDDPWAMYHDRSTTPDTHTYDAAARSNLFAMILEGYDGPSRDEMTALLTRGGKAGLLMQDPSGQAPASGRSGDHVWNDVYSGNVFSQLAEHTRRTQGAGARLAGQYRHAALLNLAGIDRWERADGSYSVTKNAFDPTLEIGYANYSWFNNYNGNVAFHSLESHALSRSHIAEQPVPSEIGGYAISTGPNFQSSFANAGGMHMQAALQGQTARAYDQYWTTLGVARFGRTGWDSRLGPSNGVRDKVTGDSASFAPTFLESGSWVRLGNVPDRYEAKASVSFASPVLVRWALDYVPRPGQTGPRFRNEFVVTPDGVLSTVTTNGTQAFGTTLPVLESDGNPMRQSYTNGIASTSYGNGSDSQNFIPVAASSTLDRSEAAVTGAIGTVRPVRAHAPGETRNRVFVYPRSPGDPSAAEVKASFARTDENFSTVLGRVQGTTYVGRSSAGGYGRSLDLDANGTADVSFSAPTQFILQLDKGKVLAVETDRAVTGTVQGQAVSLTAYAPRSFGRVLPAAASATSSQEGNPPAHAVDADAATRWAAQGDGQSLQLDLGATKRVGSISIAWYKGNERTTRFDIQRSTDRASWTTVVAGVSSSGTTTELETYPLGVVTARYMRIVKLPSSTPWISVYDARVFGW